MNKSSDMARNLVLSFFGIGAAVAIYSVFLPSNAPISEPPNAAFVEPSLSAVAQEGKLQFDKTCAACHGQNGLGTGKGPPFLNDIYNPGHHSDDAFFFAAQNGVRQHHWPFGDMPAQPQVTQEDLAKIVAYVRELQAANGITFRPHNM